MLLKRIRSIFDLLAGFASDKLISLEESQSTVVCRIGSNVAIEIRQR